MAKRAAAGEAAVKERVAVGMGVGEALLGQVEEVREHVGEVVLEMAAMAAESAAARERKRRREGERERERAVGEERAAERERARREAQEQACGRVRALMSELEEVAVGFDDVRREVGGNAEVRDGFQRRLEAVLGEKREWEESLRVRSEEVDSHRRQRERDREMVTRLKRAAVEKEQGWRVEVEGLRERVEAAQEKLMSEKLLNDNLGKELALLLSVHDKEKQRYVCLCECVCVRVCVCVCVCLSVCLSVCYTCMYTYTGLQQSSNTSLILRQNAR